jgi:hypothetical protein
MEAPSTPARLPPAEDVGGLSARAALDALLAAEPQAGRSLAGCRAGDLTKANDWMCEAARHLGLRQATFHRAGWLAMCHASVRPVVGIGALRALAAAALLLASKLEEGFPAEAARLAAMADDQTCTVADVLSAEVDLLEALDFCAAQPTVLSVLGALWAAHRLPAERYETAAYYADVALVALPGLCLAERASLVAAGAALYASPGQTDVPPRARLAAAAMLTWATRMATMAAPASCVLGATCRRCTPAWSQSACGRTSLHRLCR